MSALLNLLLALVPLAMIPGLSFHYDTVPRIALLAQPRRMAAEWKAL